MRRLLSTAALLAGLASICVQASLTPAGPRIVAIGDVHGASSEFAAILGRAGLIDEGRRWIGANAVLVQTGDVTDRGAGMRDALDLLMTLESQARRARGRVHYLLGNHEVMNMLGDLRDAGPEAIASFGGDAAMREAFGPRGKYGQWLRRKPIVARLDGTIYMHAGINPAFTEDSLDELNRRAAAEIEAWDAGVRWMVNRKLVPPSPPFREAIDAARAEIVRLNGLHEQGKAPRDAAESVAMLLPVANVPTSSLFHADGPLWFRGFNTWSDEEGAPIIASLLEKHRSERFVTGHSVQPGGRIRERFGGRLFLIDTGMLGGRFFPGGRPSALELLAGAIRPIYLQ